MTHLSRATPENTWRKCERSHDWRQPKWTDRGSEPLVDALSTAEDGRLAPRGARVRAAFGGSEPTKHPRTDVAVGAEPAVLGARGAVLLSTGPAQSGDPEARERRCSLAVRGRGLKCAGLPSSRLHPMALRAWALLLRGAALPGEGADAPACAGPKKAREAPPP